MTMIRIFKDDSADKEFQENGFVKYGSITRQAVNELKSLSNNLDIVDYVGCDFNCGMNSNIFESRKKMQENLFKILTPFFKTILVEQKVFSTSFVNKNPTDKFLNSCPSGFYFYPVNLKYHL